MRSAPGFYQRNFDQASTYLSAAFGIRLLEKTKQAGPHFHEIAVQHGALLVLLTEKLLAKQKASLSRGLGQD
jgi:hypothetical protein